MGWRSGALLLGILPCLALAIQPNFLVILTDDQGEGGLLWPCTCIILHGASFICEGRGDLHVANGVGASVPCLDAPADYMMDSTNPAYMPNLNLLLGGQGTELRNFCVSMVCPVQPMQHVASMMT